MPTCKCHLCGGEYSGVYGDGQCYRCQTQACEPKNDPVISDIGFLVLCTGMILVIAIAWAAFL